LNSSFKYSGCKIIFFDAGTYIVSNTLKIPAGTQIYGEAWAVVMGSGSSFNDQNNPKVVVQVVTAGSKGITEIGGVIFTTRGGGMGIFSLSFSTY
jgi:glucan 1,3-beta-glucosidase